MSTARTASTTELLYTRLAPIYDLIYGISLQPGRDRAMARLAPVAGERILEVGVGTGMALNRYPPGTRVAGIDLSPQMIARARLRLAKHRIDHVTLCRMDATNLAFVDGSFDAVYAPYVVNVVPDPVRVAREMQRVCRPGGRLVLLNHFDRLPEASATVNRLVGALASQVSGVNWKLDLETFLEESGLKPDSIEPVNIPRVSAVVVCRKSAD